MVAGIRTLLLSIFVCMGLAGCFRAKLADSAGESCIGFRFLCDLTEPEGPRPREAVVRITNWMEFDRSIRISIDNFFDRFRVAPKDPELTAHIRRFLVPAQEVHYKLFGSVPNFAYQIDAGTVKVSAEPGDWVYAKRAEPAYGRFRALDPGTDDPVAYRWRTTITAEARPYTDDTIRFDSNTRVDVDRQATGGAFQRMNEFDRRELRRLVDEVHKQLLDSYIDFFAKTYGLKMQSSS